jgi:hypothetical protein
MTVGMKIMRPTSIAKTGASSTASVRAAGGVEFELCTTLALNGVFTSEFHNYMVVLRCVSTEDRSVDYRLRLNGQNTTATSYVTQQLFADNTSVTAARGATSTAGNLPGVSFSSRSGFVAYFYGPALPQPTAVRGVGIFGGSNAFLVDRASTHNQSIAYDGFMFSVAGGTFSGLVTVYGWSQ